MPNIVLSILGNADSANKAVESVGEHAEGLSGKMSGIGKTMAGVFGGGVLLEGAEKVKEFAEGSVEKFGELADETRTLQRVMGGTPEQVSSMIAVGDRFGITATTMGSGMAIASKAIATGKDHFKDFGIETKNSDGSLKSFSDIMPEAVARISAIHNPTMQAAAAQELFGKGGKAMLPILTMGSDKFEEYQESAKKSGVVLGGDALSSAFKYQQAQKELNESVEGAQIQIGEKLYPTLIKFTQWVTASVIPAIKGMFEWMSQNRDLVGILATVLGTLIGVILLVVSALKVWAVVQEILDVVLEANPVGIVILAIAALIAIVVLLVTHWRQVTDFLQTVWAAVCAWLRDTLNSIGKWWSDTWNGAISLFRTVWNAIVSFGESIVRGYVSTVRDVFSGIVSWLRDLLNDYLGFWRGVWNTVASAGMSIIRGFVSDARGVWNGLVSFLRDLFDGVAGAFRSSWNGAISFLRGIPGTIKGFFDGIGGWLVNSGEALIGGFVSGIKSSIGSAVNAVSGVVSAVSKFFPHSPAPEGPFSGSGWTHYSGQALIDGFTGGMTSRTGAAQTGISGVLSSLMPSLSMSGLGLAGAASSASTVAGGGLRGGVTIGELHTTNGANASEIADELAWRARVPY